MLVAEVILPLPLDKVFHYAVPNDLEGRLVSGMRVLVQFGKRKEYAALVVRVLETEEDLSLARTGMLVVTKWIGMHQLA